MTTVKYYVRHIENMLQLILHDNTVKIVA